MPQRSPLIQHHIRRLWTRRFLAVGVVAGLILLRLVGCNEEISTSQPDRGTDDFSRYNNQTFTCLKVLDGDTIDINIPDLKGKSNQAYTRIRFWGIDTPEISHGPNKPAMYYGYEAAEFARKQMIGKKVRLELVQGKTRDRYGRLLAFIYLPDGQMYSRLALTQGYAYADYRFKHPYISEFFSLEASARKNLAGLWKQVSPDQLPYWYKKAKLKGFWEARDAGKAYQEPSSTPEPKKSRKPKSKRTVNW
jgi:micrococcal nuclease